MKLRNKKTGGIWEIPKMRHPTCQEDDISFFAYGRVEGHLFSYRSLAKLNEEWEDVEPVEPAEPLIKDEKIRKAIRAWAEANDYGNDEIYEFEDFWTSWRSWSLEHRGDDNEIHFNGGIDFDKMNHRGTYTIAELCGEDAE